MIKLTLPALKELIESLPDPESYYRVNGPVPHEKLMMRPIEAFSLTDVMISCSVEAGYDRIQLIPVASGRGIEWQLLTPIEIKTYNRSGREVG